MSYSALTLCLRSVDRRRHQLWRKTQLYFRCQSSFWTVTTNSEV